MRKVSMLALGLVLMFGVATTTQAAGSQEDDDVITIATTVYTTQHEFYADIIAGMEEAVERHGARLVVTDANGSASVQNDTIEDFIVQSVDAIVVFGVDPVAIVPAVNDAAAAGIPVITGDMRLESDQVVTFIGSDNYELGMRAGEHAAAHIRDNLADGARIGVVSWLASVAQQERLKGFEDQVKGISGVEFVALQDADGRDAAMSAAENILQANPNLDMFFGTNEGTTIGILAAAESSGRLGDLTVVGIDTSQDIFRALEEGDLLATVAQQPRLLGEMAVDAAMDAIAGRSVDSEIVVPVETVTSENVDQFK
ncbi:MAG: substrate-binding domain-containing protein [Balneolaceae bacterium]